MYIDTHCHISEKNYDIKKLIKELGNNKMLLSGSDLENNLEVIENMKKYNLNGTLGYHPLDVDELNETHLTLLEQQINENKVIGIGEIGLDYYYSSDSKELQKYFFIEQIKLAKKYNLPIVIHTRDSIQDTYDIVKEYCVGMKLVLHCYSGSLEMAKLFVKLGARLGISGVITFKNAKNLVEVVENIDIKHLLVETDCPYLAPTPFRGKQNTPLNIPLIIEKIAEIKRMTYEEVAKITTQNAIDQFDLKNIL